MLHANVTQIFFLILGSIPDTEGHRLENIDKELIENLYTRRTVLDNQNVGVFWIIYVLF